MATKYAWARSPQHPAANSSGFVREHILVAERALGHLLPAGAQVHHVNGDSTDNRNRNLVVCENDGYHKLLHQRLRALAACGDASWLRCLYCKTYAHPDHLTITSGWGAYHRDCASAYQRSRKHRAALNLTEAA